MPEQLAVHQPERRRARRDALPRVALVGLPSMYARGLQRLLDPSTELCSVLLDLAELPALLPGSTPLLVVVPERDAAGAAALLGAVPTAPDQQASAVVAVVDDAGPETCGAALRAGVTAVITTADLPDAVLTVLRCAAQGRTVLAREVVQALCRPAAPPPPPLAAVERQWLHRLAAGGTVAGLARGCGYSEREMYRRLSAVYQRLGARTRTEALLMAERYGLLGDRT